jgi:hypothetical protein
VVYLYQYLPLPVELVERFKVWQVELDDGHPGDSVADPEGFTERAEGLTRLETMRWPTVKLSSVS